MARKKIREYHAKALIKRFLPELTQLPQLQAVLVTADTNWTQLREDHPWLADYKLVAKPDMMFGQRGKHGLVLLDATLEQAEEFVTPWFSNDKVAYLPFDSSLDIYRARDIKIFLERESSLPSIYRPTTTGSCKHTLVPPTV